MSSEEGAGVGDMQAEANAIDRSPSSDRDLARRRRQIWSDVPTSDGTTKPAAAAIARLRRPVAVLLSRFPRITETFILREIDEMERQGQPVCLVPLMREEADVVHDEAVPWLERAVFTPFLSVDIVLSNLRMLRRRPRPYLRSLAWVVGGTASSAHLLVRTLALFPKAVHLAEYLDGERVGHLHAHFATHPATVALIVSELTGIGFSFTAHAHDIFVRHHLLDRKLEAADFVRVISSFNRDYLAERYPEQAGKIEVIRVGIDIDVYEADGRAEKRPGTVAEPAGRQQPPLLLAVAALEPYKGLRHLIEACDLLRRHGIDFRCDIVGGGRQRSELQRFIDELALSDRVHLRGPLPQHEVAALLTRARAFVLPSVVADDGQMEGLPVALMEAMASGCPVVTTRLSGIPELVEDGTSGLLARPGDPAGLAAALAELLRQPHRALQLAAGGRRAVATRHRIESCVGRLCERIDGFNPPPSDALVQRLAGLEWPERLAPEALGLCRLREGPDARVAELMAVRNDTIARLVVKEHRDHAGASRPARARARREYDLMQRLHAQGLGVPRPLALDEPRATVLMERCRGRCFVALLREWRFRRGGDDMLVGACRRAGRWLRHFQLLATPRSSTRRPVPLTKVLMERATADVERCRRAGVLRARDADPIGWLRVLQEGIRAESCLPVAKHGDFWPGNVFVDDDVLCVVDFEGHGTGLLYEDAVHFLIHMELYLAYPLLGRRRRRLADAFLEGFLGDRPFDEALFRFCLTAAAARLLGRARERGASAELRLRHRRLLRARLLGD